MKRKLSSETTAIISAIENATTGARIIADQVASELVQHTKHDDERFDRLTQLVESIASDVKSLIETRTFSRAVWWTVTKAGSGIVLLAGGVWALYTYFAGPH